MRELGVSNYYNRPDLNTYTWSHHVYTLGNYLHQGPSNNRPDLNTYTW
jgi:hypothetical protein